ncbi:MAG: TatD family hydrolase [Thermoanaerobaculia bacterium]|nr:TatD family hydrolase [Thermoanaerobaculia bacterium]
MPIVDTHAHLCDPVFDADRERVLERARRAGVERVVAVGETAADARRNLELAEAHPGVVLPAAGLFPTRLELDEAARLEELIRAAAGRWTAIGEVGLDHWKVREEGEREVQREIFRRFVDLALELDLPLNVHSRSAGAATLEVLLERGARRVQMHAFDGRAARALPGVEAGYYFSVPPSVLRSPQKQKLVRRLPLDRLLVETDSPVLGPVPGERNEPAHAVRSLEAIADLKGLSRAEVEETVAESTRRLYRLA